VRLLMSLPLPPPAIAVHSRPVGQVAAVVYISLLQTHVDSHVKSFGWSPRVVAAGEIREVTFLQVWFWCRILY
jgi:hypothetical protein